MITPEQLALWLERLKSGMRLHRAEQIQVLEEYIQVRASYDADLAAVTAKLDDKDAMIRSLHVQLQSLTETVELMANKPKEDEVNQPSG